MKKTSKKLMATIVLTLLSVIALSVSVNAIDSDLYYDDFFKSEKYKIVDGVVYELVEDSESGKTYYETYDLLLTIDDRHAEEINVVSEIDGIPVLGISAEAERNYYNCFNDTVKTINIPEGIKYIEKNAFADFKAIEEINIPESVETLGAYAFSGMESLKTISIPKSISAIGVQCFSGCTSLSEVIFEGDIKIIRSYAFSSCKNLKTIDLPDSLLKINSGAFYKSGLVTITIPEKTVLSGINTFRGCTDLKNVVFDGCKRKDGLVLYAYSFNGCTSLESIFFPEETKLIKISNRAFYGCKKLKKLYNSENIVKINKEAFRGCKSLKKLELGEVTKIGEKAFYGCKKLKQVTFANDDLSPKIQKNAFSKTASGIKLITESKQTAAAVKKALKNSGAKKAKVLYASYTAV